MKNVKLSKSELSILANLTEAELQSRRRELKYWASKASDPVLWLDKDRTAKLLLEDIAVFQALYSKLEGTQNG